MARHANLLKRSRCGLLVVDMQEKFIPVISGMDKVIANTVLLIKAFHELERPVLVTEQYPEGLGKTCEPVREALGTETESLTKLSFSCCEIEGFGQRLRTQNIHQVLLCGVESHVCIWQTAMDLLWDGFHVSVVKNAVSSRNETDRDTAFKRMTYAGIHLTTTEMALFELLERSDDPAFKSIQAYIK